MAERLSQTFKKRIDSTEDIASLQQELAVIKHSLIETENAEIREEFRIKQEYIQNWLSKLDKRRTDRIEEDVPGQLGLLDLPNNRINIECQIRNISLGGAMLEIPSSTSLSNLRNIQLRFKLEEGGKDISALCEIVYEAIIPSQPNYNYRRVGVKFLTFLGSDKAELESWISKRSERL